MDQVRPGMSVKIILGALKFAGSIHSSNRNFCLFLGNYACLIEQSCIWTFLSIKYRVSSPFICRGYVPRPPQMTETADRTEPYTN